MKVIELYFIKKLSPNVYQNVVSDALSVVSTNSLDDETRIVTIKKFVKDMVLDSVTNDTNTESIVKALNNIVSNDITIFDVNKSLSTLTNNDVELLFVERDDLPVESPLEEDAEVKTLIVNKIIYNSKLLCCGEGRGNLFASTDNQATAFDFIDFFDLDQEEMKDNAMFSEYSRWEVLKNKQNGKNYIDDSKMIDFLKSRGYDYYYLYL